MANSEGITCPHCGHVQTDDLGEAITYWGNDAASRWYCDECGAQFNVYEIVERRWVSRRLDSKFGPPGMPAKPKVDDIAEQAAELTDEQRLDVMSRFCRGCGCVLTAGQECYCMRDD